MSEDKKKSCMNCEKFNVTSFTNRDCPFVTFNSLLSNYPQKFPCNDKWDINKNSCDKWVEESSRVDRDGVSSDIITGNTSKMENGVNFTPTKIKNADVVVGALKQRAR